MGAHASVDAAGTAASFNTMLHGTRVDGTAWWSPSTIILS